MTQIDTRQPATALASLCDLEAESCVIGCVLLVPEVLDDLESLSDRDFSEPANRKIYATLRLMHDDNQKIDIALVRSNLRAQGIYEEIGGAAYLARLSSSVPNAAHAEHYAKIVRENAIQRRIVTVASAAIESALDSTPPEETTGTLQAQLDAIAADVTIDDDQVVTYGDMARLRWAMINDPSLVDSGLVIPTGVDVIDRTYGGFRTGALIIVAARTSDGKSALAKQMVGAMDLRSVPALVVTLEMSAMEYSDRVLSERASVRGERLRPDASGNFALDADDKTSIENELDRNDGAKLLLYAPSGRAATFEAIGTRARAMQSRNGIRVLVVDYLQLIEREHPRQSEFESVTASTRYFKQLARDLDIVVIMLSQLNREGSKSEGRPSLAHLRASGSIEQDADVVLMLHPNPAPNFELIVAKWRDNETGVLNLQLIGPLTKFESVSIESHPNYNHELAGF